MIFCGDLAISGRYENLDYIFELPHNQPVFLNLEGPICSDIEVSDLLKKRKVFNIEGISKFMIENNVTCVSLANNHITDIDGGIRNTIQRLKSADIAAVGAGKNLQEAGRPFYFKEDGVSYALLAFGWNTIGCSYASDKKSGVNPISWKYVLRSIEYEKNKGYSVIAFFHWDYEYELYPMPMQRELAKLCVKAGAGLIVGCHPHCVQGIEFYENVPIVYSLGNWIFDNDVYYNGKIKSKVIGKKELAIEWKNNSLICHWFEFDWNLSKPIFLKSENVRLSDTIKELTPFDGMDDETYIRWFKKNRRILKCLPVFSRLNDPLINYIYHAYIRVRETSTRSAREKLRWIKQIVKYYT